MAHGTVCKVRDARAPRRAARTCRAASAASPATRRTAGTRTVVRPRSRCSVLAPRSTSARLRRGPRSGRTATRAASTAARTSSQTGATRSGRARCSRFCASRRLRRSCRLCTSHAATVRAQSARKYAPAVSVSEAFPHVFYAPSVFLQFHSTPASSADPRPGACVEGNHAVTMQVQKL
jgi:hypothetical protein